MNEGLFCFPVRGLSCTAHLLLVFPVGVVVEFGLLCQRHFSGPSLNSFMQEVIQHIENSARRVRAS